MRELRIVTETNSITKEKRYTLQSKHFWWWENMITGSPMMQNPARFDNIEDAEKAKLNFEIRNAW